MVPVSPKWVWGVLKMDVSGLKMGVGVEMGGIGCRNRVGVVEWVTCHTKAGGCCGAEHRWGDMAPNLVAVGPRRVWVG